MATITPGAYTYAEWALRRDSTGRLSTLVNMLSQANEILDDMTAIEANSGNAHEYTQVVALPTATRRVYNQGVPATVAAVAKEVTTASEYADWAVIDRSLAMLGGDVEGERTQEVQLHMQGMGQGVASDLFYANRATDPTAFTGLANIYNTVSTATSGIAKNVIDGGGTGATNTSLWLIGWGPKAITTFYPQGSPLGLNHIPFDALPLKDSNNNEYIVYRDYLEWKLGLAIIDWRYAVRICNIDVTLLNGGSAANLINLMVRAVHRPPTMPVGVANVTTSDAPDGLTMPTRWAWYADRTIGTYLDLQAMNKTNVLLTQEQWNGKTINKFRGIPIRTVDKLLDTEARVV